MLEVMLIAGILGVLGILLINGIEFHTVYSREGRIVAVTEINNRIQYTVYVQGDFMTMWGHTLLYKNVNVLPVGTAVRVDYHYENDMPVMIITNKGLVPNYKMRGSRNEI